MLAKIFAISLFLFFFPLHFPYTFLLKPSSNSIKLEQCKKHQLYFAFYYTYCLLLWNIIFISPDIAFLLSLNIIKRVIVGKSQFKNGQIRSYSDNQRNVEETVGTLFIPPHTMYNFITSYKVNFIKLIFYRSLLKYHYLFRKI